MAKIQLKRSVILDGTSAKEPTSSQMNYGEIAINYNKDDPSIFIKDSDDAIIRIAGVNAKGNTPSDIQGYPDILDGEGATLDNRYLKLGSGIGAQVVQSSSATDFNGGLKVSGGSTYLLELADSGATKFVVLPTGQVGIGVTTPTAPLQVNGQVVAGSFAGTGTAITTLDAGNISQGTINTARLPATVTAAQQITIEATGSLGNLVFHADQNIGLTAFNTGSYISLTANNGQGSYRLNKAGQTAIAGLLDFESLTSDRTFTYPDESGTIALTTGLATKLPLAGGTMTGNINMDGSDLIAAGKVGIGTDSPTNLLHIFKLGSVASDKASLKIEAFRPKIRFQDRSTSSNSAEISGDNALIFSVSPAVDDSTNLTERMRIDANGNVGIGGITTPTHLLHIGGFTNSLGSTAGDELSNLRIHSRTTNSDYLDFTARRVSAGTDWNSTAQRIQRRVDNTLMGYIQLGSYYSDLITFGENNNEYARLDGSGNFGIGTSSPSEKLHVEGNLNLNGAVLGGILTAAVSDDDYVQVTTPFKGGMLVITPFSSAHYDDYPQPVGAGLMYFDVGISRLLSVMVDTGAVITGNTKLISGGSSTSTTATNFTDGVVTITTPASSTLRIFNRAGSAFRFKLVFM